MKGLAFNLVYIITVSITIIMNQAKAQDGHALWNILQEVRRDIILLQTKYKDEIL